jgi:hypothetical protein
MSHHRHTKVWSKPCCPACVKAGKSNKEAAHQYETAGKITCPMIRGRGCTYCKESAHINQECPKLAAKKEREQTDLNFAKFKSFRTMDEKAAASRRWVEAKERETMALKTNTKNAFAAFNESSSDEDHEFPVLSKKESYASQKRPREPSPMSDCSDGGAKSWSSIIGPAQTSASQNAPSGGGQFKTPPRKMPVAIPCAPRKMSAKYMDWSIESDDEDEDDYLPYEMEV